MWNSNCLCMILIIEEYLRKPKSVSGENGNTTACLPHIGMISCAQLNGMLEQFLGGKRTGNSKNQ